MENKRKTLAVIGMGFSGLSVLRHFTMDPPLNFDVFGYEKETDVGGLWRIPGSLPEMDPVVKIHELQKWNPIYQNLLTVAPRYMMELEKLSYPKSETSSFVTPHEAQQYLRLFADKFNLLQHMKMRHQVIFITPVFQKDPERTEWRVVWKNLETAAIGEDIFDAVAVCVGQCHKLYLPVITGLEKFKGDVLHSSQYKKPDDYKDKTVLVIGAKFSANDIVCHLADVAKKIILARRKEDKIFQPLSNVFETSNIKGFDEDHVILSDGSKERIDCVIACTGYDYEFPFLSSDCHVKVTNARVTPLYQHIIHTEFPTMGFIGLLDYTPIFTIDFQVKYFKAYLDGKVKLPSRQEMDRISEEDFSRKSKDDPRLAHKMQEDLWGYLDKLAADGGFETYEPVIKNSFDPLLQLLLKEPYNSRKYKMEKIDSINYILEPWNEKDLIR